jgi:GNAT superfamily N-acetyltransferase
MPSGRLPVTLRPAQPDDVPTLVDVDDDASALYEEHGLHVALPADHWFCVAERAAWTAAAGAGRAWIAVDDAGRAVGFAACNVVDGEPYLDQLSVRRAFMGRGVGRALLAQALEWSGDRPLWLTTYRHLSWNRPFYERMGFAVVEEIGPEMREVLAAQRRALPAPDERVAMRFVR